ncbi:hypothetical protein D3C87_968370 [compost metagenome]
MHRSEQDLVERQARLSQGLDHGGGELRMVGEQERVGIREPGGVRGQGMRAADGNHADVRHAVELGSVAEDVCRSHVHFGLGARVKRMPLDAEAFEKERRVEVGLTPAQGQGEREAGRDAEPAGVLCEAGALGFPVGVRHRQVGISVAQLGFQAIPVQVGIPVRRHALQAAQEFGGVFEFGRPVAHRQADGAVDAEPVERMFGRSPNMEPCVGPEVHAEAVAIGLAVEHALPQEGSRQTPQEEAPGPGKRGQVGRGDRRMPLLQEAQDLGFFSAKRWAHPNKGQGIRHLGEGVLGDVTLEAHGHHGLEVDSRREEGRLVLGGLRGERRVLLENPVGFPADLGDSPPERMRVGPAVPDQGRDQLAQVVLEDRVEELVAKIGDVVDDGRRATVELGVEPVGFQAIAQDPDASEVADEHPDRHAVPKDRYRVLEVAFETEAVAGHQGEEGRQAGGRVAPHEGRGG